MKNLRKLSTEEIQDRFSAAEAKRDYPEMVKARMALLQYDDYNYGGDSSGSGDALSSILASVGTGIVAGANVYQASQYGGTVPAPTPIYTNNVSAHATTMGSNSFIWIVILLVVGFFAYKEL